MGRSRRLKKALNLFGDRALNVASGGAVGMKDINKVAKAYKEKGLKGAVRAAGRTAANAALGRMTGGATTYSDAIAIGKSKNPKKLLKRLGREAMDTGIRNASGGQMDYKTGVALSKARNASDVVRTLGEKAVDNTISSYSKGALSYDDFKGLKKKGRKARKAMKRQIYDAGVRALTQATAAIPSAPTPSYSAAGYV
jgi:hypothetical protein